MKESIFFESGKTSIPEFLAQLSPELQLKARLIFSENFKKEKIITFTPWFTQIVDLTEIYVIVVDLKDLGLFDNSSIDAVYKAAKKIGFQFFTKEKYNQIDFSFYNPLPREHKEIIVCLSGVEWKKEILHHECDYSVEWDKDYDYEHAEKYLPVILSGNSRKDKKFQKEFGDTDKPNYYEKLKKENYFLFYSDYIHPEQEREEGDEFLHCS